MVNESHAQNRDHRVHNMEIAHLQCICVRIALKSVEKLITSISRNKHVYIGTNYIIYNPLKSYFTSSYAGQTSQIDLNERVATISLFAL